MPARQSRMLLVDFTINPWPTRQETCCTIFHALGAASPRPGAPTPINYLVAPYNTPAGTPISIGAPVTGPN